MAMKRFNNILTTFGSDIQGLEEGQTRVQILTRGRLKS